MINVIYLSFIVFPFPVRRLYVQPSVVIVVSEYVIEGDVLAIPHIAVRKKFIVVDGSVDIEV